MTDHEKLITLCYERLQGISDQDDHTVLAYGECGDQDCEVFLPANYEDCKKRLDLELQEIKRKDEAWMFLRFYDAVRTGKIQPIEKNEHNLFIWYLLEVCPSVNFQKSPAYTEAELPDIDVDYHPVVREYLKDDFSFKQYGKDHVCNIMTYQTYGIKSSLIDMARVLDKDRDEILSITTRLGLKDDEGDDVTFDGLEETFAKIAEKETKKQGLTKFEQIAKELSRYSKEHPDVWDAAKRLVAASDIKWKDKYNYGKPPRRKKSMGLHASAVIISNAKLAEFVPLVVPPGSREKGLQASAWVEGLADTDCSSVGLIKFDYLSLEANAKVAECNRLIMERHGLKSFYALPGLSNWSDTSYLNDPKALEMANAGDLKGVFQFDSAGIRKMAKKGGVTSFDDLVAYSALYRPGPMDEGMHDEYCDRKNGRKEYEIHPLLLPILGKTYGVLVYQEQVMRLLNVVGDIPLKDCEAVRKAISKKKKDKFQKFMEMFIENGKLKLNVEAEYLIEFWKQIEAFAGYGFNLSVDKGTQILTPIGVKKIEDFVPGDVVFSVDENGDTVETKVLALHNHGVLEGYEVTFDDGYKVTCTLDHKFLTLEGQKSLREIVGSNSIVLCDPNTEQWRNSAEKEDGWMGGSLWSEIYESCGSECTQQSMHDLSGEVVHYGGVEGEVWSCTQEQDYYEQASTAMFGMSEARLEIGRGGRRSYCCAEQSSLRTCFRYLASEGIASERMPGLCEDQKGKYQDEKCQDESIRRTPSIFIEDRKDNFGKTRSSASTRRETTHVERGEPGRVCQMHRVGLEKSEAIQDGGVAPVQAGLGNGSGQVWQGPKTSGLCEGQGLDRSGRILSLQRVPASRQSATVGCGTGAGRDAQQGGGAKRRCDVDTSEHGVLHLIYRGNERGVVPATHGHAGISDAGRLVSRRVVRVVPVGKRQMYDLEVASSTHNFLLPNGIVTSNSHAVAYTYISARQLVQKAHYPLEFYAAALKSLGTADERIIDYIHDARKRSIPIHPLDINKSKLDFEIIDDDIYYGFGKVKGVGKAAEKIVELQPYRGFQDFMERFGTEAKVIQPLIGLKVFKERDPLTLYMYYESFKKAMKQKLDRRNRYAKSMSRYSGDLQSLVGTERKWEHGFDDNYFGKLRAMLNDDQWVELCRLKKKYDKCVGTFTEKDAEEIKLSLDSFDPKGTRLSKASLKTYKTMKPILKDSEGIKAQVAFYGFPWMNDFERCPNYKGFTFEEYEIDIQRADEGTALPVEVRIETADHVTSRSGKMQYWKLRVTDALEPTPRSVTVWEHDYDRFESMLQPGNLVRLRLYPPQPPYPNYSLEGCKPWEMRGRNPYGEDPSFDTRVVLLKRAEKKKADIEELDEYEKVFSEAEGDDE